MYKSNDVAIGLTDVEKLECELTAWVDKVCRAKVSCGMADTFKMIQQVDKIIAEAFDHEPVID